MNYVLSIDQSTSATKALLWDSMGKLVSRFDKRHRQITNELGWIEHDPEEIYRNTLAVVGGLLDQSGVDSSAVKAIGLSNQRETAVCWSRGSGKALCNAIVWQCARAESITATIEAAGQADLVQAVTGMPLSPYFSAAKYAWMLQNIPAVREAYEQQGLCCGTIDAWLLFKLTGAFKTDYSNASRTQLLNLDTLAWDPDVVELFGLRTDVLPEICFSDSLFGCTDFDGLLPEPCPVHGVLGDSHAALYANRCWQQNTAKVTFGTGSSVMVNAGPQRPAAVPGVVSSLAWGLGGTITYAIEGNINYTGAVIDWLVHDIELLREPREAGVLAATVEDTGGVFLIPAFSGLGAPYFNNHARAAFLGLNRNTKKAQLVRAAEECIAYQIADVVEVVDQAIGRPLTFICADGGPTRDGFLMQLQADMLQIPLRMNGIEELSGQGAALVAGAAAGVLDPLEAGAENSAREILPQISKIERDRRFRAWKNAVAVINER